MLELALCSNFVLIFICVLCLLVMLQLGMHEQCWLASLYIFRHSRGQPTQSRRYSSLTNKALALALA